jgi:large subunit ribosomal protein L22
MSTAVAPRPGTRAKIRYLRMSASKVRIVLNLIRGKSVEDALRVLELSERGASRDIAKCLSSAIANAEHNDEIPAAELFVSECFADEGPTIKRFRPRARGRAGAIHKQTCHVTIIVSRFTTEEIDEQNASAAAKAAGKGGSSAKKSASASRSARVAASKADSDEAPTEEAAAEEAVEAEVVEAPAEKAVEVTEETSEATSETVDSDNDGEANASDESPYGDRSRAATDDDAMPEGFDIKGNASSKLYHVPGSSFYDRTKAEVWFATEEAAEAAGFQKPASQRDEA